MTTVAEVPFIPVEPMIAIGPTASAVQIECAANELEVAPDQDESTVETFCGVTTMYKPEKWTITVTAYLSYGSDGLWTLLHPLTGTVVDYEIRPDRDAAASVDNPSMVGQGVLKGIPFYAAAAGEPQTIEVVIACQGIPTWNDGSGATRAADTTDDDAVEKVDAAA